MAYVLALYEIYCTYPEYELFEKCKKYLEIIFCNYWTKIPQNCQGASPSRGVQTTNPIQNVKRINNFMDEP